MPAIQYHRHQRVAQSAERAARIPCGPPFSITGINEWHHLSDPTARATLQPPFSITGINEWHLLRRSKL